MFISDTNNRNKKRQIRAFTGYALLSAFLLLFYKVYISFSYGQDSIYMKQMYLFPLIGGVLPAALLILTHREQLIQRISFNLYNSGLSCLIIGCALKGIIHISGRCTTCERYYFIVGILFIVAAIISGIILFLLSRTGKVTGNRM